MNHGTQNAVHPTGLPWLRADRVLAGVCLAGLVVLSLGLAVSRGLSVADDSFIASLAKCVAGGRGYATPLDSYHDINGVAPFNVGASTGPTLVLPVAAAIAGFGGSDAVPPVAAVAVWTAVLAAIFVLLAVRHPRVHLAPVALLLVAGVIGTFGWHFELWSTVLGEVPAALLVLLALTCLHADQPLRTVDSLAAGFAFGLAMNSKLLAVLAGPGLAVAWVLAVRTGTTPRAYAVQAAVFFASAALPSAAFESWKLATLGAAGWSANWREALQFIGSQGTSGETLNLGARLHRGLEVLADRFTLSPGKLAWLAAVWSAAIALAPKSPVRRLSQTAMLTAGILLAYWMFLSKGWPRYAAIGLVIMLFSLAVAALALRPGHALAYLALAGGALLLGAPRLQYALGQADHGLFTPSSERLERQRAVEAVRLRLHAAPARLVGQWWATFVDVQFCLPGVINVYRLDSGVTPAAETRVFVANRRFLDDKDPQLATVLAPTNVRLHEGRNYLVIELR